MTLWAFIWRSDIFNAASVLWWKKKPIIFMRNKSHHAGGTFFKNPFNIFRFSCLCYTKMLNNLNTFLPVTQWSVYTYRLYTWGRGKSSEHPIIRHDRVGSETQHCPREETSPGGGGEAQLWHYTNHQTRTERTAQWLDPAKLGDTSRSNYQLLTTHYNHTTSGRQWFLFTDGSKAPEDLMPGPWSERCTRVHERWHE